MFHAGFYNEDGGWDSRLINEQEDNFKRFAELIVEESVEKYKLQIKFLEERLAHSDEQLVNTMNKLANVIGKPK